MKALAVALVWWMGLGGTPPAEEAEWELVFEDDFERAEIGPAWKIVPGMSLVEGRLRLVGTVNAQIARGFKPDVRLEFDGWAIEGIPPCDMSATLAGGELGMGYILGFGARNNRANHLVGPGVDFVDLNPPFVIETGRKYHCVALKEGRRISYRVNGTTLIDVVTEEPLGGPGFDLVGILAWTGLEVDGVRVYERREPHPDTPVTIVSIPDGPLYREGRTLVIRPGCSAPGLEDAVGAFNAGRLSEALQRFRAMDPTPAGLLGQAYVLGDLGYMERFRHPEFSELAEAFAAAAGARPEDRALAVYALLARWFARLEMRRSGLAAVAAIRLRQLGEGNNPFFHKARLYEARYAYWNGAEGGDRALMDRAVGWLAELKAMWPDHIILRQYCGEQIPWGQHYNADTGRHPAWAAWLREAYARQVEFMHHFIEHRQDEAGGFGGGWGDDCEMMRTWMPVAVISTAADRAREGIRRLAEGIWTQELGKDGYADLSDVEHSAEPSADMLPGMLLIRYGDPLWVARNLVTCRTIRDLYMGLDARGYPRFRSSTFGGGRVDDTVLGGGDSGYCARAMKHFLWEAWRGNPEARDWFVRWVDGWRALTMAEEDGKIRGVIPWNVWFPSGSIRPPVEGAAWHDPRLNYIPRPDMIADCFLAAYSLTGDARFLRPFQLGMHWGSLGPVQRPEAPAGSREWQINTMIGYSGNVPTEQCRPALYRWLTGDPAYDDFILAYGEPHQIYRATGDLETLLGSFRAAALSLRTNLELQTTEVLSTDRCGLPAALAVFGAYTGAQTGMRDAATPTFAVTYDTPGIDFAALVLVATDERLRLWLYNFGDEPMPVGLKIWRLRPGRYVLTQGELVPGERAGIRRYAWREPQTLEILRRAEGPTVTVPPSKVWGVDLRLDEPVAVPARAPDLAVTTAGVTIVEKGLEVTVYNIGSADAGLFSVTVQQGDAGGWATLARATCEGVPRIVDFSPGTTRVFIPLHLPDDGAVRRIHVELADSQFDLDLANNVCPLE